MMEKSKIETELSNLGFTQGKLMQLISHKRQYFWLDGPEPVLIQHLMDEHGVVTKEYITGKNGHMVVEPESVLLFLGVHAIDVVGEDTDVKLLEREYHVLKWLFGDKVLFWSYEILDGRNDTTLADMFKVVDK